MALLFLYRRPEGNPLDLNNLPDEYSRDGKQVLEDHTSSTGKLHDRTYTLTYTRKYQRNIFFLCIFRILFPNHSPWEEGFHFSQETKLNTAVICYPPFGVYSLTMKQCSSNSLFFFLFHSWFLSWCLFPPILL